MTRELKVPHENTYSEWGGGDRLLFSPPPFSSSSKRRLARKAKLNFNLKQIWNTRREDRETSLPKSVIRGGGAERGVVVSICCRRKIDRFERCRGKRRRWPNTLHARISTSRKLFAQKDTKGIRLFRWTGGRGGGGSKEMGLNLKRGVVGAYCNNKQVSYRKSQIQGISLQTSVSGQIQCRKKGR